MKELKFHVFKERDSKEKFRLRVDRGWQPVLEMHEGESFTKDELTALRDFLNHHTE